jgi:hypothetical protein
MYFTHHNFGLITVQTLQQKIFGGATIKLIINQSKLESDMPNNFVNLLAWISQIIGFLKSSSTCPDSETEELLPPCVLAV